MEATGPSLWRRACSRGPYIRQYFTFFVNLGQTSAWWDLLEFWEIFDQIYWNYDLFLLWDNLILNRLKVYDIELFHGSSTRLCSPVPFMAAQILMQKFESFIFLAVRQRRVLLHWWDGLVVYIHDLFLVVTKRVQVQIAFIIFITCVWLRIGWVLISWVMRNYGENVVFLLYFSCQGLVEIVLNFLDLFLVEILTIVRFGRFMYLDLSF